MNMDLYYYMPDSENFQFPIFENEADWNIVTYQFDGRSLKDVWQPISMHLARSGKPTSFPGLSMRVPAVTYHAWEVLKPYIRHEVEALPLDCKDEPIFALNVINLADCLDVSRSQLEFFNDSSIMEVKEYAFREHCIDDFYLFVIKELPLSGLLVTDRFRKIVEENGLVGLNFLPIRQSSG